MQLPPSSLQSPKRRRESSLEDDDLSLTSDASKRQRLDPEEEDASSPDAHYQTSATSSPPAEDRMEHVRDEIRHQFGLEVLLKHNELRLINQELAKCQASLEQLRRCHLIPFPVNCPTPEQMMMISSGNGPALRAKSDEVPRWAPPFGVADGPYARHYAKWLIPDPAFDGIVPRMMSTPQPSRSRGTLAEERSARNALGEAGTAIKGRAGRAAVAQKLQALPTGHPQPKDKAGPCILKRADGQYVKLVCMDCHRENFSSTQGFINHCRIAHKREFKTHEVAAAQSGQPVEAAAAAPTTAEERPSVPVAVAQPKPSSAVHPFSRHDAAEQEAYAGLRLRIDGALKLYRSGKLPSADAKANVSSDISQVQPSTNDDVASAPFLSLYMKHRKFNGNLGDIVADARTRVSFEDITPDEEEPDGFDLTPTSGPVRRMPATTTASTSSHPPTLKHHATHVSIITPPCSSREFSRRTAGDVLSDEDIDMDEDTLSPNTMVSINAPSLVSDDGEYDDSDDGSSVSGETVTSLDDSASDVAEITFDEEHDVRGTLRRGSDDAVNLRKDDDKSVTLMRPVKKGTKGRRAPGP